MAELELPRAFTLESLDRLKPDQLQIVLAIDNYEEQIYINAKKTKLVNLHSQLSESVTQMKKDQLFPNKAILHIHSGTPMRLVNDIKTELQKQNILKVKYVHQKKIG